MEYEMKYIAGHIEVYDSRGRFCFSSDTEREARLELEEYSNQI